MKGLVFGLLAISITAQAQMPTPTCTPGFSNFRGYVDGGKSSLPYFATIKATFEHSLSDGNMVSGSATFYAARDGQGKSLVMQPQICERGENGEGKLTYAVSIKNSAQETFTTWSVGNYAGKIVTVTHYRRPQPVERVGNPPTVEQVAQEKERRAELTAQRSEYKIEDLGTKYIAGVEAHGSRSTRTIPAGKEGNKEPLVIIDEKWDSKDVGMMMMTITDDPRYGKTVYEVTVLDRSIPDPALFLPPADYKVEEHLPDGTITGPQ